MNDLIFLVVSFDIDDILFFNSSIDLSD